MRGVNHQTVDARFHQFVRTFFEIAGRADGCGYSQATQVVLGGGGVFDCLLDVFDRDQSFQMLVVIDDQKLFDAMFLQDCLCLIQGGANRHGHKRLRRHYLGHW